MKAKRASAKKATPVKVVSKPTAAAKPNEILDLIAFVAETGLAEVNVETKDFKVEIKRTAGYVATAPQPLAAQPLASLPVAATAPAVSNTAVTEKAPGADAANKNLITIKSPMIGTFYRSSGPDVPSFVNVGDTISPGKAVCIIEAMKLFNEIEAEVSGKIVKILVDNSSPVEYDQPLFLIEPK